MSLGLCEDSVVLHDAESRCWLHFCNPLRVCTAHSVESVMHALREVERATAEDGLHAAGFIAYEASPAFDPALVTQEPGDLPLVWFGIYREPERVSLPPLPREDWPVISWIPSISESEYHRAFQRVKDYIEAGDTYQVNYSFRLRAPYAGDPWGLFVRMIHAQDCRYGAFVNTGNWSICSASPELFFAYEAGGLICRPMKGTASRGFWHADDLRQAEWLVHSEKNRAENVMIVDMARNDMGKIAEDSSVEVACLFDVEKYPTLWQMTSTVTCKTRASLTGVLQALFPAASITGAPKVRTMQIITELESAPRRIYTGSVGFVAPGRKAQFNVAIRTVLVDKRLGAAEYGVGGGIVWDSEKACELQECHTKARVLVQPYPRFDLLETLLWTPRDGYFLPERHLARMAGSAAYFSRNVAMETIRRELDALAPRLPRTPHKIRLVVSAQGELTLDAHELSPLPQPYRVCLAMKPVDSHDPFLYHKTTHRGRYNEALAGSPGFDDVLLWNEEGHVTESCIANIVVEQEGRLITPSLRCGLLPGVYRSLLLEQGTVEEAVVQREHLSRCSRVFLANSVRGMFEVSVSLGDAST